MKALRLHPIALSGRVMRHARRQIVQAYGHGGHPGLDTSAQRRIRALAGASPG